MSLSGETEFGESLVKQSIETITEKPNDLTAKVLAALASDPPSELTEEDDAAAMCVPTDAHIDRPLLFAGGDARARSQMIRALACRIKRRAQNVALLSFVTTNSSSEPEASNRQFSVCRSISELTAAIFDAKKNEQSILIDAQGQLTPTGVLPVLHHLRSIHNVEPIFFFDGKSSSVPKRLSAYGFDRFVLGVSISERSAETIYNLVATEGLTIAGLSRRPGVFLTPDKDDIIEAFLRAGYDLSEEEDLPPRSEQSSEAAHNEAQSAAKNQISSKADSIPLLGGFNR